MAKYLRVCSDLHLEQYREMSIKKIFDRLIPEDPRDAESILILAGDISSYLDQLHKLLEALHTRFESVIYVPGNHEYYGYEISEWAEELKNLGLPSNVFCSYNSVATHVDDGVRYVYSTLWSDGGRTPRLKMNVQRTLRDFYVVKVKDETENSGIRLLEVRDIEKLHQAMRKDLEEILTNQDPRLPTVVITHHMPSLRLCHPRFGNHINGGFASNLDMFLSGDHAPNMWICGHTHDAIDTRLWKTDIVCNPAGYVSEYKSPYNNFNNRLFIEIDKVKDAFLNG